LTLDPNLPPPVFAPAPRRANAIWFLELVPLGFGIVLGWRIAYEQSVPGNELGGLSLYLLAFFLGASLGVIALALLLSHRGRAAGLAFVAAAAIVVGTVGTFKVITSVGAAAPDLGVTYVPPVVVHSIGTTEITLVGVRGFAGVPDNGASCVSLDNSPTIGTVQTLSAGELGGGTLRATLTLDKAGGGQISFWVDAGDLAAGETQPFWDGVATIHGATSGNASGDATFNAPKEAADAGKGPSPSGGSWPAALTGTLHWTCRT
jgi:hypothetical protein